MKSHFFFSQMLTPGVDQLALLVQQLLVRAGNSQLYANYAAPAGQAPPQQQSAPPIQQQMLQQQPPVQQQATYQLQQQQLALPLHNAQAPARPIASRHVAAPPIVMHHGRISNVTPPLRVDEAANVAAAQQRRHSTMTAAVAAHARATAQRVNGTPVTINTIQGQLDANGTAIHGNLNNNMVNGTPASCQPGGGGPASLNLR